MHKFLATFVFFALLVCGSPGASAAWEEAAQDVSGNMRIFVDTGTIADMGSGYREAWVKHQFASPRCESQYAKAKNRCISEQKYYMRFTSSGNYCVAQLITILSNGSVDTDSGPCTMSALVRGSVMDATWRYVYATPAANAPARSNTQPSRPPATASDE